MYCDAEAAARCWLARAVGGRACRCVPRACARVTKGAEEQVQVNTTLTTSMNTWLLMSPETPHLDFRLGSGTPAEYFRKLRQAAWDSNQTEPRSCPGVRRTSAS